MLRPVIAMVIVLILTLLSPCYSNGQQIDQNRQQRDHLETELQTRVPNAKMANPASTNCVEQHGGRLEVARDDSGGEFGICWLGQDRAFEEWCLFRTDQGTNQVPCANLAIH